MYHSFFQNAAKMLLNIGAWLDKAEAHAAERKTDPVHFLNARLVPDQFHLTKQIQVACDNAKLAAARLSGGQAPVHEDNETTVAEIKSRINATADYLRSLQADDFSGAADRQIVLPFMPDLYMNGDEYFQEFVVPNFYFHLSMAYAILRESGVNLGKQDFMGSLPMKPLQK
jgi:hypothetical protein